METNYYTVLGIPPDASLKDIKKAYMKLALKYHPDKNHEESAVSKFHEIKNIYEILCNPLSKRDYDIELYKKTHIYKSYSHEGTKENAYNQESPEINREIYKEYYNHYPEEIIKNVVFKKNDFIQGRILNININVADICQTCFGKSKNCKECNSTGQIFKKKMFEIRVPPLTKPGSYLRLPNAGHKSPYLEGQGDIFIHISWPKNKEEWYIENNNVYTNMEIKESQRGQKVKIKNFDGMEFLVKIPVKIKDEQSLRIKKKGWFISEEERGDLIVTFFIKKERYIVIEKTINTIKSFIGKN